MCNHDGKNCPIKCFLQCRNCSKMKSFAHTLWCLLIIDYFNLMTSLLLSLSSHIYSPKCSLDTANIWKFLMPSTLLMSSPNMLSALFKKVLHSSNEIHSFRFCSLRIICSAMSRSWHAALFDIFEPTWRVTRDHWGTIFDFLRWNSFFTWTSNFGLLIDTVALESFS